MQIGYTSLDLYIFSFLTVLRIKPRPSKISDKYSTIELHSYLTFPSEEARCFLVMEQWLKFSSRGKNWIYLLNLILVLMSAFGFPSIYFSESFGLSCLAIDENKTNPSKATISQNIWGHRTLLHVKRSVSVYSGEIQCALFWIRAPSHTVPH